MSKLTDESTSVLSRAARFDPRHNVYGLARTLIALGTFATLVSTPAGALFHPVPTRPTAPYCAGLSAVSGFCVGPDALGPDVRRFILGALLVPVIIGWRPRYFGVVHWWVTFSLVTSISLPDGGDSVAAILTLASIPFCLVDDRRWHFSTVRRRRPLAPGWAAFCYVTSIAIRVQVAGIYFTSAVAKFGVREWADGTALYYWMNHGTFGLYGPLKLIAEPLLANGFLLGLATWGVLLAELSLAFALFWPPWVRSRILWVGVALHLGIAVGMGLFSFAMAMFGALVLAMLPLDVDPPALRARRRPGGAVPELQAGVGASSRTTAIVREDRPQRQTVVQ